MTFGRISVLAVIGGVLLVNSVRAQDGAAKTTDKLSINIRAQPLRDALREFGEQAGLQVLYRTEDVRSDSVSTVRVSGELSPREALERLLARTGLTFAFVNPRTVRVMSIASSPTPPMPAMVVEPVEELETVSISASRIQISTYDQPTPVTVVGTAELQRDARVDIAEVIRELPSFGGSTSPNNSNNSGLVTAGVAGLNLVSLRNLGTNRTLVLFDGQRVVSSSIQGGVDLTTMPSTLVERIDVVTGGASAAWGSDAVAGVVNVIVNKHFDGLQVNLEASDNWHNEHAQRKAEVSYGSDVAGGRGHIVLSASVLDAPDTFFSNQTEGYQSQRLVTNPAFVKGNGQPQLIHANDVGLVTATPGGIITDGPLKGIYFVGPNGTPAAFDYGNVSQRYFTNGGTLNTSQGDLSLNSIPFRSTTFFALGSFKLSDGVNASLQLNFGHFSSVNNSYSDLQYGTLMIKADNPYVPASVAQQVALLGLPSFPLGTTSTNNLTTGRGGSLDDEARTLGIPVIEFNRNLYRGVFSLDGSLGADWSWNAYVQHGESRSDFNGINNQQNSLYALAVDAVRATPANVGTSGLPLGSIACRSTLTNPSNGCAPLNVFGTGVASDAAIAYVNRVARAGGETLLGILKEDVGSASMQGTLPFGFPAGRVSTAFGAEYRREEGVQEASPAAQASTFQLGNFKNFYGKYNVKEGFLELNAPVLRNSGVRSLSFDVAGRYTDYSTSGLVETFKVGVNSQIVDDLRFRASYSYDIRAPGLTELFNSGTPVTGGAIDPRTGLGVSVFVTAEGNRDLKPEKATTTSAGIVLSPRWLQALTFSVDYYNIDIKRAISSFSSQTILAQCAKGDQTFCSNVLFNGPNGALSEILVVPLNSDSATTSGFDFAGNYRSAFLNGAIDVTALANYTVEQTQTSLGQSFDFAGSVGDDGPYSGVPKFKGQVAATYVQGGWAATVQLRAIGSAKLNNAWGPNDVDDNDVAAIYYLDARGSYKWDNGVQVYGAIDNLADRQIPIIPPSAAVSTGYERPFRDDLYDGFGRVWRIGVRAMF